MSREKLSVRVDGELLRRVRELAHAGQTTVTNVVEWALAAQVKPDARPAHLIRELRHLADRGKR